MSSADECRPLLQVTFDLRLARFYMWAQTSETVYIAVRVPTGAAHRRLMPCFLKMLASNCEGSPLMTFSPGF